MGRQQGAFTKNRIPQERLVSILKPVLPGYIYVPKGDVYITRHCRAKTIASGLPLYVVHPHGNPNQKLGLRVPVKIANEVFADSAKTTEARAQTVKNKDLRDLEAARDALVRLYPKLPADSVDAILSHGFKKKSGRVGRAGVMDLDQRVIYAVYAYARHTHTRYEKLLKMMDKDKARRKVRQEIEDLIQQWSGSAGLQEDEARRKSSTEPTISEPIENHKPQRNGRKAAQSQHRAKHRGLQTVKALKASLEAAS